MSCSSSPEISVSRAGKVSARFSSEVGFSLCVSQWSPNSSKGVESHKSGWEGREKAADLLLVVLLSREGGESWDPPEALPVECVYNAIVTHIRFSDRKPSHDRVVGLGSPAGGGSSGLPTRMPALPGVSQKRAPLTRAAAQS